MRDGGDRKWGQTDRGIDCVCVCVYATKQDLNHEKRIPYELCYSWLLVDYSEHRSISTHTHHQSLIGCVVQNQLVDLRGFRQKWKRRPETAMTVVVLCSQGTNFSRGTERISGRWHLAKCWPLCCFNPKIVSLAHLLLCCSEKSSEWRKEEMTKTSHSHPCYDSRTERGSQTHTFTLFLSPPLQPLLHIRLPHPDNSSF